MIWHIADKIKNNALKNGALHPITSHQVTHHFEGVEFTYHLRNELAHTKPHQTTQLNNPFLPHEQEMFVAHCGLQHKVLLNKYPIIQPHLLICTNQFVPQNTALTLDDFNAWLSVINDKSAAHSPLGFYNSEPTAGASQPHRHMQVVQLALPLQDGQPFLHTALKGSDFWAHHNSDSNTAYQLYLKGLVTLELLKEDRLTHPYNLLITPTSLWLLPRSQPQIDGIYANGLNFTGHFLLKDQQQLNWLLQHNPFNLLKKLVGTV